MNKLSPKKDIIIHVITKTMTELVRKYKTEKAKLIAKHEQILAKKDRVMISLINEDLIIGKNASVVGSNSPHLKSASAGIQY